MNIFLDTNVIMDHLAARGDMENVGKIFHALEEGSFHAFISVGSYYTITYLLELFLKNKGVSNPERLVMLRDILESLLARIDIAEHSKADLLIGTLNEQFKDLEDSYQYQAAIASDCSYLVTSNLKDFPISDNASVSVVSPSEFVQALL